MIRSIRPTDFASFLAFLRKGNTNDAKTGRNLGRNEGGIFSIGRFFSEWLSLDEDRYTWVDTSRGRIRGLISVRARPSPVAWQIDSLILSAESDCQEICPNLLNYVAAVGAEVGVYRVFLRMEKGSSLTEVARQAGFLPYKSEMLYAKPAQPAGTETLQPSELVRNKRSADELPLFHLYSATVPGHVREAEAMTFDEWKAITKKDLTLPTQQEFVMEREGNIIGWLRVRRGRQANSFDMLSMPDQRDATETLLKHSMAILDPKRPTFCLLPDYRHELRLALEDSGFVLVGEYSSSVKQLAVRIRQPRFAPARI